MIHWIIEELNYANDFNVAQRLIYLAEELGHKVTTFKYKPFGETVYDFIPKEEPTIFYGGINALIDIRSRRINTPKPFAWYDPEQFKCSTYYDKLNDFILQKEFRFLELDDLNEEFFGESKTLFLRPDDNEKSFTGQLVDRDQCRSFVKNAIEYKNLEKNLKVVAANPQKIYYEWRMVIVDGKVASGSQYMEGKAIEIVEGYPEEVKEFAEKAASHWSPFPVFILDVCQTDEGCKVIEIGPFNYAGLYRIDLRKVVLAIESYFG